MTNEELFAGWEARCQAIGRTLSDLRKSAGIHPANFSNWKSGKGGITLASIGKLEAAMADLESHARSVAA